jgi:hypothetical protein
MTKSFASTPRGVVGPDGQNANVRAANLARQFQPDVDGHLLAGK